MSSKKAHFLIGTRWFGVLGPCELMIDSLHEQGYEVFVFGQKDSHYARYDRGIAKLVEINMSRSYSAYLSDFLDIIKLMYYMLRYRPVGVHSFNPKPALLSWAAVNVSPKSKFYIGVTGLGNTFIRAKRMEPFITKLLRRACKRASFVFFQNQDDIGLFKEKEIVSADKAKIFIGPGVDLRIFNLDNKTLRDNSEIVITCTARLIWQKGIREYVEAARIIREKYAGRLNVTFKLVGEIDHDHPDCIDEGFLVEAVNQGHVEHISWTDDVAGILKNSDIFVLHSYREGAPRAILEASACGLPTVGADAIGVRELVIDEVTGYLTPLKDVEGIVTALEKLINDKNLREEMGAEARKLIAVPYSLKNSSDAQMEMYRETGYTIPHIN